MLDAAIWVLCHFGRAAQRHPYVLKQSKQALLIIGLS